MAKVLISVPSEFLACMDKIAKGEMRSLSELVREAIVVYAIVKGFLEIINPQPH